MGQNFVKISNSKYEATITKNISMLSLNIKTRKEKLKIASIYYCHNKRGLIFFAKCNNTHFLDMATLKLPKPSTTDENHNFSVNTLFPDDFTCYIFDCEVFKLKIVFL